MSYYNTLIDKGNHSLLTPLLESLSIRSISMSWVDCGFQHIAENQQFLLLEDNVITSNGSLIFDLNSISELQLTTHHDQCCLTLRTLTLRIDQAICQIKLHTHQEANVESILNYLKKEPATEALDFQPASRPTCPCCTEREIRLRKSCHNHPLTRILHMAHELEQPLHIEALHQNTNCSTEVCIQQLEFDNGIAWINAPQPFYLDIASIHGIQLSYRVLDGSHYSSLSIYNSFAEAIYTINVKGKVIYSLWQDCLESRHPAL